MEMKVHCMPFSNNMESLSHFSIWMPFLHKCDLCTNVIHIPWPTLTFMLLTFEGLNCEANPPISCALSTQNFWKSVESIEALPKLSPREKSDNWIHDIQSIGFHFAFIPFWTTTKQWRDKLCGLEIALSVSLRMRGFVRRRLISNWGVNWILD